MKSREAGTTLIEILVAVSLLGMLSVGVLMSMRSGMDAMGRTNDRLIANRKASGAKHILENQLQGFIPAAALCSPGPDVPRTKLPFFQGETQTMRFVSGYSLDGGWRGLPRILEYLVIPRDDGKGFRLIVNEIPYTGPLGAGRSCLGRTVDPVLGEITRFVPVVPGPASFVLADNLAYCRFEYQEQRLQEPFSIWKPVWNKTQWPSAVRIEMAPTKENPAGIQPLTVTAPVRVDRFPIFDYVD